LIQKVSGAQFPEGDLMASDRSTTIQDLRDLVHAFVEERDWEQYHNPKNLALSIAIEAAEIMERFQWLTQEQSKASIRDPAQSQLVGDELADVMIYCFALANQAEIDVSSAVRSKLSRNKGRFPVGFMPT
jgi:NTP pyrophosphatase (non-canonical NTP hydrolase)